MKRVAFLAISVLLTSCAKTIPADAYGVHRLQIEGMHQLDEAALRACLATGARERLGVDFGTSSELECNKPPFNGGRVALKLWPWPWTAWPVFDASIFERDLDRIERWFRARGFYEARVERTVLSPPSAGVSDEIPQSGAAPCRRNGPDEGCPLDIEIRVEEGRPVLVRSVEIEGLEGMDPAAQRTVHHTTMLKVGDRWDEALYDDAKQSLIDSLREAGFACVTVAGHVDLDPSAHSADIHYRIETGPQSTFGNVTVEVEHDDPRIPKATVRAVAGLDRGERYSPSAILSAQSAVYGLGAFGAVEIVATPRRHPEATVAVASTPNAQPTDGDVSGTLVGSRDEASTTSSSNAAPPPARQVCEGVVDVSIRVTPGRRVRWGIGGGMQAGTIRPGGVQTTTNQAIWDIHLLSFVEHRNLFGGLRRLRIEERPKMVFAHQFPTPRNPAPGNELRIDFRQPAFLERRTVLEISGRSDLGLDPWNHNYRHALDANIAVRRTFWNERVLVSLSFHASQYKATLPSPPFPNDNRCPAWEGNFFPHPTCAHVTPDNHILFLEQYIQFDRRNDARNPRRGVLASIDMYEGGFASLSSWQYFRVIPDFRFFIPLPWRMVLAGRFGIGAAWVKANPDRLQTTYASPGPTPQYPDRVQYESTPAEAAVELGPQQYRLRGGGQNDNRGFGPGQLGDVDCAVPVVTSDGTPTSDCAFATNNLLTPFVPIDGGLRKWIASLELRMHLTESFGLVLFADMGDVNRASYFRFYRTNLSIGGGIRYDTIVGPLRFDVGWRVPGAAGGHGTDAFGRTVPCDPRNGYITGCPTPYGHFNVAFNITIGEAF